MNNKLNLTSNTQSIIDAIESITNDYITDKHIVHAKEIGDIAKCLSETAIEDLHNITSYLTNKDRIKIIELTEKIISATYLMGVCELIRNKQTYKENISNKQTESQFDRGIPSNR